MAQTAREKALQRFRDGKVNTLVATDVAARGIDVAGITHVINYNCPEDHKTYVHRIGRTGRAGASGIAVTFVDWADMTRWKLINKELDLPFDEPQETYSTSEHLFHDLGIPRDTKGRLKPAAPREPRADSGRDRSQQRSGGQQKSGGSQQRSRNRRSRNRTRGGQTVKRAE
jgi:superfamily II DNA/RNA helicase